MPSFVLNYSSRSSYCRNGAGSGVKFELNIFQTMGSFSAGATDLCVRNMCFDICSKCTSAAGRSKRGEDWNLFFCPATLAQQFQMKTVLNKKKSFKWKLCQIKTVSNGISFRAAYLIGGWLDLVYNKQLFIKLYFSSMVFFAKALWYYKKV